MKLDLLEKYKWIKIVLKHFNKEYEWWHSNLKYFAADYTIISYPTKSRKDLFPMKISIYGYGCAFFKYLKIYSFGGHGLFVNLNQHKIIYRLRHKTSNFEKIESLRHFEFDWYHVTEANFQVAPVLKTFWIDPNTTSNHQNWKMF